MAPNNGRMPARGGYACKRRKTKTRARSHAQLAPFNRQTGRPAYTLVGGLTSLRLGASPLRSHLRPWKPEATSLTAAVDKVTVMSRCNSSAATEMIEGGGSCPSRSPSVCIVTNRTSSPATVYVVTEGKQQLPRKFTRSSHVCIFTPSSRRGHFVDECIVTEERPPSPGLCLVTEARRSGVTYSG
ncbi:hypothetical protein MRX96_014278 [Rhipicephalus microplus]